MLVNSGMPDLPEEETPKGDNIQRAEERNRQLFLLGGAMGAMGGYMGPVYPFLFDSEENQKEDPNP